MTRVVLETNTTCGLSSRIQDTPDGIMAFPKSIFIVWCYFSVMIVPLALAGKYRESSSFPGTEVRTNENIVKRDKMGNSLHGEPVQKWQYVPVRPGAFMFWWLYQSTSPKGYQNKPLVIWLQGGPGSSSTGFGNFNEIGPLDVKLKPRKYTWLTEANLLFIDNPVGTGFSYVTDDSAYTTNVMEIAEDLVTLMKTFLSNNTEFQSIPLFIFSESYGGKMAAVFGQELLKAIKSGRTKCNLKGIAMGDSWISPVDSVLTWAPYLYSTSLIDERGFQEINNVALAAKEAADRGQWKNSTDLWAKAEDIISAKTNGVNVYNILDWKSNVMPLQKSVAARHLMPFMDDDLSALMNGPIRRKLGNIPQNVTWGGQAGKVFDKQNVDFMKPVVNAVDQLLQGSDLKIVVYSGQLDMIVDTMGTEMWVQKLKWPGLANFNKANRPPMVDDKGATVAFLKTFQHFSFYWILDAGHMIPADQPKTAIQMLRKIIN